MIVPGLFLSCSWMPRRKDLMRVTVGALFWWFAVHQPLAAKSFNVRDFGAVADGKVNDSIAINKAIDASCAAGSGNEVVITAGTYRLQQPLSIKGARSLIVRGEPGTLLMLDDADTVGMELSDCQNLTIKTLTFDRRRLSFTQGTITVVDEKGKTCDVSIDPGYADPDVPFLAGGSLHPFLYPQSGTYKLDDYTPEVVSWQKIDGRNWRANLKDRAPSGNWVGKKFFFWAGGRGHCIVGHGLSDCLFEDITYWGGGGNAGLYLGALSGAITFRHFVIGVPPGSDRMLSCAGGGQISDVRGTLDFEDCDFSKIDDDGLDLLATWTRVVEPAGPRTLRLQVDNDFRAGDSVEIWDWPGKKSRASAKVVQATRNPDRSVTLQLDRDVAVAHAGAGDGKPFGTAARDDGIDRIVDLNTLGSRTDIRNCHFQVFRAKCLNLKAPNCTVDHCRFVDSWQPAISAAPEWYFQEGPAIRNLTIRDNQFYNCNHSNIEIGASPVAGYDHPAGTVFPSRDSADVLIEGNYFAGYGGYPSVFSKYWPTGDAIRVQNARHVTIRHNTFGPPAPGAPKVDRILVSNSQDVVTADNEGLMVYPPAPLPAHSLPVDASQERRLAWFRDAKFGMFIHWGLYSVPAGEWEGTTTYGEWIMKSVCMPAGQYAKFATQFNPVQFDPKAWAKVAAAAGMKYMVLTTKHHEGFALWDTRQTDFNVVKATPFGRDVVRELADACRAEGLRFCVYYSDTDWRDPDFPARYNPELFHGNPKPDADIAKYLVYMKAQLTELLSNYGPLGIVWFDNGGGFGGSDMGQVMHGQELVDLVHRLQPDCLVNNRAGVPGDYTTPEQEIPPEVLHEPWETCMTMNGHWGYNKNDHDWKSTASLIHDLVDIVSKGGNFLLNVGPTADGVMPPDATRRLAEIGRWLQANGDAIYGAGSTPFGAELGAYDPSHRDKAGKSAFVAGDKWRFTTRPGKLFAIFFTWPGGPVELPILKGGITAAHLLDQPASALAVRFEKGHYWVDLPAAAPDPIASVVELDVKDNK